MRGADRQAARLVFEFEQVQIHAQLRGRGAGIRVRHGVRELREVEALPAQVRLLRERGDYYGGYTKHTAEDLHGAAGDMKVDGAANTAAQDARNSGQKQLRHPRPHIHPTRILIPFRQHAETLPAIIITL